MSDRAQMRSFGEMLWIIHSLGLYSQISMNLAVDNHVSGNGRCVKNGNKRNGIELSVLGCVSNEHFWGVI